ncbi:MAG: two-component sensor histidine kinase [Treponema sp.]|nr:two-component sensor histidine kinase [Treponema sp.]
MRAHVRRVFEKVSKLSSEQVEEFVSAVAKENDMLDSVIESLSTGLVIVDDEWTPVLTNKTAERFLPFSVHSDDARFENTQLWQLLDDETIAAFLCDCAEKNRTNVSDEFSTVTASGNVRFIIITLQPLIQRQAVVGTIITVLDITEKRNQEILLRRMEHLAGLTNLAAGMAHEIKNPLGAISIHIQLMQKAIAKARTTDNQLPEKKFMEQYLDIINEEIDDLNKTVMDFLMAVRPVNAKLVLVDPARILQDITEFIAPEFIRSGIMVNIQLCKQHVRLLIDEKLFRDAIMNIAQNALAAIRERFPSCSSTGADTSHCAGRLDFTTVLKEDIYCIVIQDNGIGMSEDVVARIFEPYYTTKANGTGLGMTMVYKIIKEFSGDIQVQSWPHEGTTFTITIPVPQTDHKLLAQKTASATGDDDEPKIADKMAAV